MIIVVELTQRVGEYKYFVECPSKLKFIASISFKDLLT